MPAVVGLGVALAVVVLAWIGTAVVMKMRRERRRAAEARRTAAMSGPAGEGGLDPRAAAVIRDAERVLTLAREEARKIVEEAEARASEIVAAAERRGDALLTDAERSVLRQQEIAKGMRRDLVDLVRGLLEDVEGSLGKPLSNGHAIEPAPRDQAAQAGD